MLVEKTFIQILSDEGILKAIAQTPSLLFLVVSTVLFTIVSYFVIKKMIEPLLSKRDAQDMARAISNMSTVVTEMASSVRQLQNTLVIMYQSFRGESISVELITWLIREMTELYPSLLVGNIISMNRSDEHIDWNNILLAIELTLRDMNTFFVSAPNSPLCGSEQQLEDVIDKIAKSFLDDYKCAFDSLAKNAGGHSDEFVLLDELVTIHATARKHIGPIRDYLRMTLSVANFSQV